ncbi:MAG: radical SAM protein [Candidatus Hydrogenedentota bacterium]
MKILFILLESNQYPRFGIMCLSSALKEQGHEVALANLDDLGKIGLRTCIRDFAPDVIGYSAMTGEHLRILALNRALKHEFDFVSVLGGPHATFAPDTIDEEPELDALCVGEADIAFPEFCNRLEQNRAWWESPNFVVRRNGDIYRNSLMPLVEELDSLPIPDHRLIFENDSGLREEGTKIFFSGRGCPYACTYCFNEKYNELYRGKGSVLRTRSPESLVEEVAKVKDEYPLIGVWFHDDTFLKKPERWFDAFAALYKERIGLPFTCFVRPNLVTEQIIARLRDAGLRSVWMGVECGDEQVANDVLRRKIENEEILNAARILQHHGVMLVTQNLMGLPVQNSYQTDLKTLDLNIEIAPTFAWSSILYPYPGTPIQQFAIDHGFLSEGEMQFLETNKRSSILTFSDPKEKRKIENLHKLFGVIVRFPWLRRHVDFLVSLPLGSVYRMVYYLWFGYIFKWKLFPFRAFRKEIGKFARLFFRMFRKT